MSEFDPLDDVVADLKSNEAAEDKSHADQVARLTAERDAARKELADHMATHEPTPEPEPEPTTGLPPLIGSSAPDATWSARKRDVEGGGGKLEARRMFFQSLGADPTTKLKAAVAEGLVPVISYKVGPYNWSQMASGQGDAGLRTLASRIKAVLGDRPFYLAFHHEPDQQSNPKDVGEGGSGADFGRMQAHIADVLKPLLPSMRFGVIMNGWWWSAQSRGFNDAEMNVWLPKSTRDRLDFIGADHYNNGGGETALDRLKRHVAYLDRVGYQGAVGIGETNGQTVDLLVSTFNYAKTEPRFRGGFICVWNSEGENYLQPGSDRLTAFQRLLAGWR